MPAASAVSFGMYVPSSGFLILMQLNAFIAVCRTLQAYAVRKCHKPLCKQHTVTLRNWTCWLLVYLSAVGWLLRSCWARERQWDMVMATVKNVRPNKLTAMNWFHCHLV
jgi:hypothetical protein